MDYPYSNHYIYNLSISPITAPVPEPETYAMLFAGIGIIGIALKRRRTLVRTT